MRLLTAGYSHSGMYTAVLEGLPAGIIIDEEYINLQLSLRRQAAGRSLRMSAEDDRIIFFSGIIDGKTTGAPIGFGIETLEKNRISFYALRPGHADYPGAVKYGFDDLSLVAERASARETVNTVAAGSICRLVLKRLGIIISSAIISVGGKRNAEEIQRLIVRARKKGDTLGGVAEVTVSGVPAGFGGYSQYDQKLDGRLAAAIMSLPAVKAVEIGLGCGYAAKTGSMCADLITLDGRSTNNSGGIDGGMSNGSDIVVRFTVKPVPTLQIPQNTVDIRTRQQAGTVQLRADTCAVPGAAVCAEAAAAMVIFDALQQSLGGDTIEEMENRFNEKRKNDFLKK